MEETGRAWAKADVSTIACAKASLFGADVRYSVALVAGIGNWARAGAGRVVASRVRARARAG